MTDTVQLALIVGLPPTITALAGLYVSIRNGGKADVIAAHVNSAATASVAKIEALQQEVQQLRAVMATDAQRAALLAQSAAQGSGSGSAMPVAPAAMPVEIVGAKTTVPVVVKKVP